MPSYFFLQIGMCRGENVGENKKSCHWRREYFMQDGPKLASVNECEDGFMWRSPAKKLTVPSEAKPSTEAEYEAALARWQVKETVRKAELEKKKERKKELLRLRAEWGAARVTAEPAPLRTVPMLPYTPMPTVVVPPPTPMVLTDQAHFLDDFTIFDTETTGLSPENNRILELAAVRYKNWEEVERLQLFVRFTGEVPFFITKLTGITSADVRQASESKVVLGKFRQLAGESLLIGHNVGFDVRMIEAERTRLGAVLPLPNQSFCTMELAKKRTPAPHKLGELCTRFHIPVVGAHRALNDVLMTYELLRYFHQQQPIALEELTTKRIPVRTKQAAQPSLFAA